MAWGFAILVRLLASLTQSHWFHLDEWCQTFEPAMILAHGFGIHSQEIGLHLRNLTAPSLLAGALKLAYALDPLSIDLRIFCVNALCGLLDLGILWGWIQLLHHDPLIQNQSQGVKQWGLALLLLPWFTIYPSVSPRAEHLSEVAFWIALGCMTRQFWIASGFFTVAIAAFRYPSALLSVSLVALPLVSAWKLRRVDSNDKPSVPRFLLGLLFGVLILGLADAQVYGRPWESLWMYAQYNLLTHSSQLVFGRQSLIEYTELFRWNWTTSWALIPLGLTLLVGSGIGIIHGLKRGCLWAGCLLPYAIGHSLIGHKEGRFMIPLEKLLLWAGFTGCVLLYPKIRSKRVRTLLSQGLILTVVINAFVFLHHLKGDLGKKEGTFRELGTHLQKSKSESPPCAVLTSPPFSPFQSLLLPFTDPKQVPEPAVGLFSFQQSPTHLPSLQHSSVQWLEREPNCRADQSILLHAVRAHPFWQEQGCELLPSGFLRFLPTAWIPWVLKSNYHASTWYRCPSHLLQSLSRSTVEKLLSHQFQRIPHLPPLGISAQQLEDLGHQTSPPPRDSVLPTLAHPEGEKIRAREKTQLEDMRIEANPSF
ncbi:MAG: hypothetical protein ACO3A2_06025 [Bdellovibrionia bacterium]